MATKKITGIPEIDLIASSLSKKFGKDSILSMGPKYEKVETISTGSISLNQCLGVGGIPNDRIIEIFGPPSAGKTSLSLQIVSQYVADQGYDRPPVYIDLERTTGLDLVRSMGIDRPPVYIDLERTTGLDLVRSMGIDPEKMIFCYPDTAEEALQLAQDLGKTGKVGLIIFDSIDAAQSEKETKRLMNEVGVGDLPRLLSKALRSISKISVDNKCCYIFINQIRMNIGVMYGNPETTSGGNALPFYSSVRLRVSSKPSSAADNTIAMKVKIVKNKVAPALNKVAEFDFICAKGTDKYVDIINYAKDIGFIRFAGPSCKYFDPETGEELVLSSGGKAGLTEWLLEEKNYQWLETNCVAHKL